MSDPPRSAAARGASGTDDAAVSDRGGRDRKQEPERERGQTNIDFVVGIALFLLAVSIALWFMPRIVSPYEDPEKPAVAERAAATLADDLLTAGREPGVLDVPCTGAFFVPDVTGDCPFGDGPPEERLGIAATYRVNATLRWNVSGGADPEILCYEDGEVGECGSADELLAVGPQTPRDHRSVAAEKRVVLIGDQPAILSVRVW